MGDAVAGVRAEEQEDRSGRHQRPQPRLGALEAMAQGGASLPRALHQLLGVPRREGQEPHPGLVRQGRRPAADVLRRHLDQVDERSEGEGGRGDGRALRVPHHRGEQDRGRDPPEGHAGDPDRTGGMGNVADRAVRRGESTAAAAAGRRAADRGGGSTAGRDRNGLRERGSGMHPQRST